MLQSFAHSRSAKLCFNQSSLFGQCAELVVSSLFFIFHAETSHFQHPDLLFWKKEQLTKNSPVTVCVDMTNWGRARHTRKDNSVSKMCALTVSYSQIFRQEERFQNSWPSAASDLQGECMRGLELSTFAGHSPSFGWGWAPLHGVAFP